MTRPTPDQILTAYRDHGLTVVETPGWRTRGTGHPFDPVGQMWHHDALNARVTAATALHLMINGRPKPNLLPGPLCNDWVNDTLIVYMIAYGNANHAGWGEQDVLDLTRRGLPPKGDANTDPDHDSVVGNSWYWGHECHNAGDGVDPWEQYDAMCRLAAACSEVHGHTIDTNIGHKEWTARKPDPKGISMPEFRTTAKRYDHRIPDNRGEDILWLLTM